MCTLFLVIDLDVLSGGVRTQLRGTPPKLGVGMWGHGDMGTFGEMGLSWGGDHPWGGYMGTWGGDSPPNGDMGTWKVWWAFDGHLSGRGNLLGICWGCWVFGHFEKFVGSLGMDEDMGK